jgi:hypothetical protein
LVTLVLLQDELPLSVLSVLANVKEQKCAEFIQRISAVLCYQPEAYEPVRLLHASFSDFLTDPARCPELSGYGVNAANDHLRLAERCLDELNTRLRYNICNINELSLYTTDDNLKNQLRERVPLVIKYASKFWAIHWLEHIRSAKSACRIPNGFETFCTEHTLRWIEILSLVGNFNVVQGAMHGLIQAMSVRTTFWFGDIVPF